MGPVLWLVGIATVLLAVLLLRERTRRLTRNGRPLRRAPDTLPLLGNGIKFLQSRQKLFSWFIDCERQFGHETFQISVPTLPLGVVINDPQILDYVFKNEGRFSKGVFIRDALWDLFGYGIINAGGTLWKTQRKAGLNFINNANLRVLTDVALPRYLSQSVEFLRARTDGTVVDLQAVFLEITSQLMGKMAYNMEMHSDDDFTQAFDYASGRTMERFQNPLWPITEMLGSGQFRNALSTVRAFGRDIVAKAIDDREAEQRREAGASPGDGQLDQISGSLIRSLLDSVDDDKVVADAALNYLSAGRDTTAQALTWTFYMLMKHQSVTEKIRRETEQVLQGQDAPRSREGLDATLFTPSSLPYTMAVFCEVLRLYPPVPFQMKQCGGTETLPDGTYLPKLSIVVWCLWAMNRSKQTWGEDAESFRPERWLRDGKLVTKSPSEYPVFNGGPRTCLGKKMAEAVAVQVVATMVWRFDFAPTDDGERISKSSLTLPMEGGLPCLVRARSPPGSASGEEAAVGP